MAAVKDDEVFIGAQALPVGNSYKQKVQGEILKRFYGPEASATVEQLNIFEFGPNSPL